MEKTQEKEVLAEQIRAKLAELLPGTETKVERVLKNNNLYQTGITVKKPGLNVAPIFYIDATLSEITRMPMDKRKEKVEETARQFAEVYREKIAGNEDRYRSFSPDREMVLQNVRYRLIHKRSNRKKLRDAVYRDFLDLAVLYDIVFARGGNGAVGATAIVKKDIAEALKITPEELEENAERNSLREGFEARSLSSITGDFIDMPGIAPGTRQEGYVVSNPGFHNGAYVMLFSEPFEKLAEQLGGDLYICPSSVHEVIVYGPCSRYDSRKLKNTIASANREAVEPDEILSYNLYRYNRATKKVEIV